MFDLYVARFSNESSTLITCWYFPLFLIQYNFHWRKKVINNWFSYLTKSPASNSDLGGRAVNPTHRLSLPRDMADIERRYAWYGDDSDAIRRRYTTDSRTIHGRYTSDTPGDTVPGDARSRRGVCWRSVLSRLRCVHEIIYGRRFVTSGEPTSRSVSEIAEISSRPRLRRKFECHGRGGKGERGFWVSQRQQVVSMW